MWQGIQHCIINMDVRSRQFIQNDNNINVACVTRFPTAVTTLQTDKSNAICESILYGIEKCVYPIVDIDHFVFSFAVLMDAIKMRRIVPH